MNRRKFTAILLLILLLAQFAPTALAGELPEGACPHAERTAEVLRAPACTEDGLTLYTCVLCGETFTETVPAPGHALRECFRRAPTCLKSGAAALICTRCGELHTEDLPALGHDFPEEGEITTAPACLKSGVKPYFCTRCGEPRTEDLPALGHDFPKEGAVTTAPTCTAAGVKTYACSRCPEKRTETMPALGHDKVAKTVRATWRSAGSITIFCARCGYVFSTAVLKQLTHLAAPYCPAGDADMDGNLTPADARLILRLSLGIDDGLDNEQRGKANYDGKGGVTPADARSALRAAMGLEQVAPVLGTDYQFSGYTSRGYVLAKKNGVTYVFSKYGYTLIANKTYSLPSTYTPYAFQGAEPEPESTLGLTPVCREAFAELQRGAAKEGVSIWLLSGYRSYSRQQRLYNNYAARDGKAAADTYSARPGHSEHQTGLAMDVNSLSSSFANTKEGRWLAANAHKYGFVIRYPSGKQSATGFIYEPWHIRYLGKELAAAVYASGQCLEEFFGITSVYAS